jgi:hypothetical protein
VRLIVGGPLMASTKWRQVLEGWIDFMQWKTFRILK